MFILFVYMQEYIWNIIDKPLNPNAKEERISIVFVLYVQLNIIFLIPFVDSKKDCII